MKKLAVILFISSVVFTSCKKQDEPTTSELIVGKWKTTEMYSYDEDSTFAVGGEYQTYEFNGDGTGIYYRNGEAKPCTYSINENTMLMKFNTGAEMTVLIVDVTDQILTTQREVITFGKLKEFSQKQY